MGMSGGGGFVGEPVPNGGTGCQRGGGTGRKEATTAEGDAGGVRGGGGALGGGLAGRNPGAEEAPRTGRVRGPTGGRHDGARLRRGDSGTTGPGVASGNQDKAAEGGKEGRRRYKG